MFDSHSVRKDFSAAASQYDAHATLQERVLLTLLGKAQKQKPLSGRILDAGCGTGRFAKLLAGQDIVQLDLAYDMCAKALKGGQAINGNIESLPFADNSFDMVFSSLALQWLHNWHGAIEEMQRVLKPGGVLAISTFGDGTLHELQASFASGDRYPHVSWFVPKAEFDESETITEIYPDVRSLMKYLKAIGARNKLINRRKSLMTERQLNVVESYYQEHFASGSGVKATWEVLYSVREKR